MMQAENIYFSLRLRSFNEKIINREKYCSELMESNNNKGLSFMIRIPLGYA